VVKYSWIICTFGNVCTIEAGGMCPECVAHFDLFGYSPENEFAGDYSP
jgi:hypothetical protein